MSIDYRDTLNLPRTDFPMKANLARKEPEMLRFWQEKAVYAKVQEKNRDNPRYILHDGPPYANGNIHIGHALNKILKDIIVKYKSMRGFYSPYVPGWDCHGLPIELQVDRNLGDKKEGVDVFEKRRLCREYAERYVSIQREEFRRLGVAGDWERPYLTLSHSYEASIVREFFRFVESGAVYKGKKPVHWCPSCVTALAEAEVEYSDKESPSVFVRFRISDRDKARLFPDLAERQVSFVIWTTTPWTLPANLALAVHPDHLYAAVEHDGEIVVVAEENLDSLALRPGIQGRVRARLPGSDLEGARALHPFIDRESPVIAGSFVAIGEGTGIVHIAPGHGEDDYETGLAHGLDIYAPVDDRGRFTTQVPRFQGQFVFKANEGIVDYLKEKDALLGSDRIVHSYPHCWRCKKPVIFRATEQWFISMDAVDLRRECLEEIERVSWIPSWGKERILGMVRNRPDWCISRQRTWGVPIPLFTCTGCGEFINDSSLFESIVSLVESEGADVWFRPDADSILDSEFRCRRCGGGAFKKEQDILDVWFDSGVSHAAVLERDDRLEWPADLYLEGNDQHRGWFQSSLLASVGTRHRAPYRAVLTHGFTVDGQGKKMSKSLGNVISPQEIIRADGAEIVRLWVSAEDYRDDVRLSREIISRLTEAYRKIRNTQRFLIGNLYDFDGGDYRDGLLDIDRWAMSRLHGLIRRVTAAYDGFDFHEAFHAIYSFCVVDLSSFYLDILKDRMYTFKKDSPDRRAAQWVFSQVLRDMTRLLAPILSFTAEEVWSHLPGPREESVFLAGFPTADDGFCDTDLEERWGRLIAVRNEVNKAIEIKRKEKLIGNSLEAGIVLYAPAEIRAILQEHLSFLPTLLIVSQAEVRDSAEAPGNAYGSADTENLFVLVRRASGRKCERCWNWNETTGRREDHPGICRRCSDALTE